MISQSIALLLLMASCTNQGGRQTPASPDSSTNQVDDSIVSDVERGDREGIVFKDENGERISLKSLEGKVVFINFWATWCPPCIEEMPSIDKLYRSYKQREDVVFLTVDVDNKIEQSTSFMRDNGYQLPVYTPASNIPPDYLGGAIPTTVILARDGEMIGKLEGGRDYSAADFVQAFDDLVNESP